MTAKTTAEGLSIHIRNETPSDIETIFALTKTAFENHPHSNNTEHHILTALRNAGALVISLVAEVAGKTVGHIAFSPVSIADGSSGWYGLGPVSVLPSLQGQGIGKALIHSGLALLQKRGAQGCVLAGDPNDYGRFGFRQNPDLTFDGVPQEYFLALHFDNAKAHGVVTFHEGFFAQ